MLAADLVQDAAANFQYRLSQSKMKQQSSPKYESYKQLREQQSLTYE